MIPACFVSAVIATTSLPSHYAVSGRASYYSRSGCLGCSENMIMKNGEPLDDEKYTIAVTPQAWYTYSLKNKRVRVRNIHTDLSVYAQVADTGGFAKYGRIADISVAVKRSIRCSDVCTVEITQE